jgi:hypothetical protein
MAERCDRLPTPVRRRIAWVNGLVIQGFFEVARPVDNHKTEVRCVT